MLRVLRMETKKIISIILIVLVLAGCIIAGYYAYGYYMNQKFEENFKLQYQAGINGQEYLNASTKDLEGKMTTKTDYETSLNNYLKNLDKAIEYSKTQIGYLEEMVKYSPDDIHKKYSEALLKYNQEFLKYLQYNKELQKLWVWPGVYNNETKVKELSGKINDTLKTMEKLNNEKDKAKLQSSELNNQIQNLSAQAELAIS